MKKRNLEKAVVGSTTQASTNPACKACLRNLTMCLFGEGNHYPERTLEALNRGDSPEDLLQRIFAAKLREIDFYYQEKVIERLRKAGENHLEDFPSFLEVAFFGGTREQQGEVKP